MKNKPKSSKEPLRLWEFIMITYLKCGKNSAVSIEFCAAYGVKPIAKLSKYKGEYVLDMPYMRLIITPGKQMGKPDKATKAKPHDDRSPDHAANTRASNTL